MSNCESLDTCIIIRLIIGDDPLSTRKIYDLLSNSPETNFYLDDAAIIEAVYVLSTVYHLTRQEIADSIEQIFKPLQIIGNYDLFAKIFPFYVEHPALSFNDCYLSMKSSDLCVKPLWTLDQKLANQSPNAKMFS